VSEVSEQPQALPPGPDRWRRNREHWRGNLDTRNLDSGGAPVSLERELALYQTADITAALNHLRPAGRAGAVLDLGGGLGLMAILLAREGARVVIADLSLPRLKEARKLALAAGVGELITFVNCVAEELPFANRAFHGETAKSVLIHTDLPRAAAELDRVLREDGAAFLIEPLKGNPFARAYRRLAAPKVWQEITSYFDDESCRTLSKPFARSGRKLGSDRRYFLAFLATPLNYILRMPRLYRIAETALLAVDAAVAKLIPYARRGMWFVYIRIEPGKR